MKESNKEEEEEEETKKSKQETRLNTFENLTVGDRIRPLYVPVAVVAVVV